MESRVKKKAMLYGVLAILLATFVTAFAFEFGVYDLGTEPLPPSSTPQSTLLTTFNSYEALRNFLASNSGTQGPFPFYGPEDVRALPTMVEGFEAQLLSADSVDFSTTNIQVAGVDEADIVKTDGEYLYVLSGDSLLIMKAYPPEATEVVANMTFGDLYPIGIFVEGDRLTVLGSKYFIPTFPYRYGFYVVDVKTFARIYDIQDKANPVLLRDLMLTGSYFNSRMIDDYVYFVVSQPAYIIYDTVVLPKFYENDRLVKEISPSEIHYYNGSDNYYQYTTFVAVNMQNATEAPTYMTIMLGGTSSMYVSQSNMYVTFPEFNGNTTIYRIRIQDSNITAEAKGQVIGNVLNQFSMDEYDGYFRIATTTDHIARTWEEATSQNHIYVLDMNLNTVGKLENLAPGEKIYSARFMGNRCYLVTFRKVDPLFVVDLNPSNPEVLGQLKITGYSDYLHPYDENHVIGIGKETVAAEEGDFAWYQGVKISLFNVSDVSKPKEMSKYEIGDRGTSSPVLSDHKAFLFDKSKRLLVLPVLVAEIDEDKYPYGVPPYTFGDYVWQGAYVFNISIEEGLILKGRITHLESSADLLNSGYHFSSPYSVKRSLYIDNVLYTISDKKIKLNNLETLALLKEIPLA